MQLLSLVAFMLGIIRLMEYRISEGLLSHYLCSHRCSFLAVVS